VRRGALVLLAVVLASSSACTRTKTLDGAGLNGALAADLSQKVHQQGITVSCPDDVPAETGHTFDCTATNPNGTQITLHVTESDDQGHVMYQVAGGG
jgi:Domain of unknown function (DUF4333)